MKVILIGQMNPQVRQLVKAFRFETHLRGATSLAVSVLMVLGISTVGTLASAEMSSSPANSPRAPRIDAPMSDSGLDGNVLRGRGGERQSASALGGPGYFTAAAGVGLPGGLRTDNAMLNLEAAYNINYTPDITGKVLGSFNIGTGSDNAYFNDIAVGANYYIPRIQLGAFKPYLGGDAGLGFVRNDSGDTAASLAVAVDTGFQWLAQQTALDVSLRYEVLAASVAGSTPALIGLNAGMNF